MKKKILIVDDEVDLVKLIEMRLKIDGLYYVMPLYTSARTLEIAKKEKPDLILLDIMMPDKDGYEVCKELKEDPETRDIPIILFTAQPDQKAKIKKAFKTFGASDFILKPFEMDILLDKIKGQLKNS
jgi:response regulator RpfG family c-di-GMP phosphodiesterase